MAAPSAALDTLPLGRKHLRLLTGSGLGWALDAMDVGLISFIIVALRAQWDISDTQAGLITSVGFVGMAIGAGLGGLLADRLGRRQVFAITLLVYGIATGASALVGGVAALIALRFVVGLGLGSELPVASSYVSEFAPARIRGRLIVVLEAFWAVGWTASAVIGTYVVGASDDGWRWAFLLGAVPAVYAVIVRFGLPESPRWLESVGRFAESQRIVADFTGTAPTDTAVTDTVAPAAVDRPRSGIRAVATLWHGPLAPRTAAIWLVWFCVNFSYYGAFIWIPSILVSAGFDIVRSFEFTLLITLAQLPGYAVAAWLIEVWGRRATLATFLAGSAGAAVLFGTATEVWQLLLFGSLLSFFNLGAWGALYAVTPELYPTTVRATGAGWAAGVGRIASIVAPLFTPWALAQGGAGLVFTVFAIAFAVAAVATIPLGGTKGTALAPDLTAVERAAVREGIA